MSDALVEAVTRYTEAQDGESPFVTAIDGLTILRSDHEQRLTHLIVRPALCLVVQGAKWAVFGEQRLDYRVGQALMVSVEMPVFGRVSAASPSEPYLGLIVELDLAIMREVLEGLDTPPAANAAASPGLYVTEIDGPLADCALRVVRLLGTPRAIPLLYPLVMREICYWLLTGPHGGEVAGLALANSHTRRLIDAIHALRDRFAEPVRIEDLARIAHMSASAFHRQFKLITSMTPLQYQKQLRLLEAHRLMVAGAANAETAAYQVGYKSPSQFSRDYARMFGAPPRRDMARLRVPAA